MSEAAPVRLRLVIAYDGTHYQGWQMQKYGQGVEELVAGALRKVFPGAGHVHGSSRTDAGVHALGLVAHVDVPRAEFRMPARKALLAINAHLPEDIRLVGVARARPEFHARFDALGKEYRYRLWNAPVMNPLLRQVAWHVPRLLDLAAMRAAAAPLVGRHDFRAFTANPGYQRGSTVRTLTRVDVRRRGPEITVVIEGDGFLYKMCRGIAGTLVQAGLGKLTAAAIPEILAGRDRRQAGMNAPALGLTLWRVKYGGGRKLQVGPEPGFPR
ncbi:MAG: tRNA pseudouridine(38-40) synthase TruA [Limisphaerales bacterium]